MSSTTISRTDAYAYDGAIESNRSGVSWAAIIAGSVAASAVSLILLSFGSGVGLASMSPWSHNDMSLTAFTMKTAIWLIIMQWVASGVGGYLAGRLRSKWVDLHTHEVFFRDTAHGFLAWSLATVITAAFLASAASSAIGGGVKAASMVAPHPAPPGPMGDPNAYFVDSLYRTDHPADAATAQDVRAETTRLIVTDMKNGSVPDADKTYLAQLVSARTGLSQADATARVNDVLAQVSDADAKARQLADDARKAGKQFAFFTAFSMLIGAFIASVAATLGGKRRDA